MKAIAKLFRKLEDGTLRQVQALMTPAAMVEILNDEMDSEVAIIRFYHGNCLEAEAKIAFSGKGSVVITLVEKKEMTKEVEAVCGS